MSDWREQYLKRKVKQKTVLDLGVGDTRDRSLHRFLSFYAKKVIGVELNPIRAKKLRERGFDVRTGNAETVRIKQKFDIVIAGDLIEHLNNPGLFLETVKAHLKKEGVFIFNTPNAYAINFLLKGLFRLGKIKQFEEHTLLFDEDVLKELLRRHQLKIKKINYFSHKNTNIKSATIRFFASISKYWHENIIMEVIMTE